jgi:predicted Zn finger-like uncharacterized protein
MIIQCRKCETRFRFDDHLMEGDGVWVRCSRCRHVFFQERAAGDLPAAEPEIPSVRISDARRTLEDRFPIVEERPLTEVKSEIMPQSETGAETALPVEFEREPSFERPDADPGRVSRGDPGVGLDKEKEAEDEEEEDMDVGTGRKRWGWTLLKLIALLFFILIVAGMVSLYLFPEIRTQVLVSASPWLREIPVLEKFAIQKTKDSATVLAPVRINKEIRQHSVANLLTGNLRVIEGVAVNQAPYPLARIRVRLVIADAYDVVLGEKIVFCGNILTDAELGAMAETEIQRELSIPQGSDFSNERIAPNGEIPFMIVFNQEQAGAVKTTILPAGADRIP